ncbi:MAG: signal peptidase II [Candidatus Doudnabacteria bacterium]|nr:signal peptidase II [Candidatus Doudnabacteria bacterium]
MRMLKSLFFLILLDQITKAYFVSRDFFVRNYGLPFGLDFGLVWNIAVVLAGLFFFVWYYIKTQPRDDKILVLAFALVFAGAISNLLDRLFLGFVRDFADLGLGFVFNLADIFIAIGLILIFSQTKGNEV